jgi:hypothetical protein
MKAIIPIFHADPFASVLCVRVEHLIHGVNNRRVKAAIRVGTDMVEGSG